jgi:hypothetical protein
MQEERGDLRHADLERVAQQVVAARGELVVPAAIEIVGGVRIAEQAGELQAQVARVDRHHDVALIVDDVLKWGERVARMAQHRVIDQALLAAEVQRLKGTRM